MTDTVIRKLGFPLRLESQVLSDHCVMNNYYCSTVYHMGVAGVLYAGIIELAHTASFPARI